MLGQGAARGSAQAKLRADPAAALIRWRAGAVTEKQSRVPRPGSLGSGGGAIGSQRSSSPCGAPRNGRASTSGLRRARHDRATKLGAPAALASSRGPLDYGNRGALVRPRRRNRLSFRRSTASTSGLSRITGWPDHSLDRHAWLTRQEAPGWASESSIQRRSRRSGSTPGGAPGNSSECGRRESNPRPSA
jgi:hypothetical protein